MSEPQPEVSCKIHGRMRFAPAEDRWKCAGFDGEGCDLYVSSEETAEIARGHALERVAAGEFGWRSYEDRLGPIRIEIGR